MHKLKERRMKIISSTTHFLKRKKKKPPKNNWSYIDPKNTKASLRNEKFSPCSLVFNKGGD
jgi:hypothetical protein